MRTKCFYYVVALITFLAGPASATEKTAPLVPVFSPTRPAEIITRFHDAFGSGLAAGGMATISAADVRVKVGSVEKGCAEGSCVTAFGAKLGTQRLATAHVSTVGKNYNIKASLFVGRSKVTTIEQRCDICTVSEALRSMTEAGRDLAKKAAATATPKKPPVEPKTPPVTDPTPKPVVPPKVKPETHPIPEAPVTKPEPQQTAASPKGGWPLWPALVSAGVGVVGLSVGIPLLTLDGDATNCVGPPRADNRNCADLYDTAAGGWLMTGVGITAIVASGVLLYLYLKKGNREAASTTVSLVPTDGGMALGAHGSF